MRISYSVILLLAFVLTMHSSAFADIVSQDTGILQVDDLNIEDDESDGIADIDSSKLELLEPVEIIPAEHIYDCWNNHEVNPYKVRLTDTPDTFLIDMSGYCHPTHNVVTSSFGFRRWKYHYGIDLRVKIGDSIKCAFDGKVRIAKRGKAYGNYVVVRHYNGLETTYAHMSKLLVKVNDEIKAGELVGWGGNTGRSTGPHLHFEMRYLGVPVNPKDFVDFTTGLPVVDTLNLCAQHFEYVKSIEEIRVWIVKRGDSLWKISQRTGISINTLCRLNNIPRNSILRLGQRIRYT